MTDFCEKAIHVHSFIILTLIQVYRFLIRVKLEIFHTRHHIQAHFLVTLQESRQFVLETIEVIFLFISVIFCVAIQSLIKLLCVN